MSDSSEWTPPERAPDQTYLKYTGESKLATAGIYKGKVIYAYLTDEGGGRWIPQSELEGITARPEKTRTVTPSPEILATRALITERDQYRTGTPEWEELNKVLNVYEYKTPTEQKPELKVQLATQQYTSEKAIDVQKAVDMALAPNIVPERPPDLSVNVNEMLKPAVSVPVDINAMLEEVVPVEESKPTELLDTAISVASASPRPVDLEQMQSERGYTATAKVAKTSSLPKPVVITSVAGGYEPPVDPEIIIHTTFQPDTVTHLGIDMTRAQFEADFWGISDSEVKPYSPVQLVTDLPDPDQFIGIPGPASARKPGSLGEKIQTIVDTKILEIEEGIIGFETGARKAGRQIGAEAQIALSEGDVGKALLLGTAAFSARAAVGVVEGATFLVRPLAWEKTAGALLEGGKQVLENPGGIPGGISIWAKNVAHDPGSIVEFAGDIMAGYAIAEIVSTISGPTSKVGRVEGVDIEVKSTTLGLVDEIDPLTGRASKALQLPESEIIPTITSKRIPRAVAELMDAELDDFRGPGKILGVADEGGVSRLEKIDVPPGVLDDLREGKTVTVDTPLGTETVGFGAEKFTYVDDVGDPITGRSFRVPREDGVLPLEAKELGPSMEVFEDASRISKIALEGDEMVITPSADVVDGPIKFGGPWHEDGIKGVLEPGDHRYDVKGVIMEKTPTTIDDIPDFVPIEPGIGSKTSLNETFGFGTDAIQETLVKEITEGSVPFAAVITEPVVVSKGVSLGVGLGAAALEETVPKQVETVESPQNIELEGKTGIPGVPFSEVGQGIKDSALIPIKGRAPTALPIIDTFKVESTDVSPVSLIKAPIQVKDILPEEIPIIDIAVVPERLKEEPTLIPVVLPTLIGKTKADPDPQKVTPFITLDLPIEEPTLIITPELEPKVKPKPFPLITDLIQEPDVVPVITPILKPFQEPDVTPVVIPTLAPIEIADITPIVKPELKPIQETAVIPLQEVAQEQKLVRYPPSLGFSISRSRKSPFVRRPQKKGKHRRVPGFLVGFEKREVVYRSPKELFGDGKIKSPFGKSRRKRKGGKLF